jgi:hypothetical protein
LNQLSKEKKKKKKADVTCIFAALELCRASARRRTDIQFTHSRANSLIRVRCDSLRGVLASRVACSSIVWAHEHELVVR